MGLELKLSLRLSQRLVMTPALQQAIKLLQMSTLELREEIATELQENPALEESQDQDAEEQAATADEQAAKNNDESTPAEADGERESLSEVDLEYMLQNYYDGGGTTARGSMESRERESLWETNLTRPPDLSAHLTDQMGLAINDPRDQEIGRTIIGNLDEAGYLQASLEEMVAMGDFEPADVERVLSLIQSMDPAGVAAHDLQECLLIQLRRLDMQDSPAAVIIRDHLDLLQGRRYEEIARHLNLLPAELRSHLDDLRKLDPRPGDRFAPSSTQTVTPDVMVV